MFNSLKAEIGRLVSWPAP